jgi:hypothetical protein
MRAAALPALLRVHRRLALHLRPDALCAPPLYRGRLRVRLRLRLRLRFRLRLRVRAEVLVRVRG